jgi:hypothetical protein
MTETIEQTWDEHLQAQLREPSRRYDMDMVDGPEHKYLITYGELHDALTFLRAVVAVPYNVANSAAGAHQRRHRWLARTAILTGAGALMLAILQLGLLNTNPSWTEPAAYMEVVAAIAGVIAVAVGATAKFDRHWFIQRHLAERLRMLKFRSLGQPDLWCGKTEAWKKWVTDQVGQVREIAGIEAVKSWAEGDAAAPLEPIPADCVADSEVLCAYSNYYRWKRVEFQAAYFSIQAAKYRRARPLARLGLPLFFMAITAVVIHIIADIISHHIVSTRGQAAWHLLAVWALVLAAMLPVVNLCVRAWLGAFEHLRSASLFEAKHHALIHISGQLDAECGKLPQMTRIVAHVEHFLEHEHREWLRLMLEAEWL